MIRICGQKSLGGVGEKVMNEVSGRGHYGKRLMRALFSHNFSSRFGRMRFLGPGEKIFSRVFHPQYFPSFAKQWKTLFSTPFFSLCFPSSLNSPQPNTV